MTDSRASRRKLSPVGKSWLRGLHVPEMNLPEATVTALIYFDRAPSKESCIKQFEEHVWPLYRFSSTVQNGYFVQEEVMDKDYHFTEKEIADEAAIEAYAQQVMSEPLDKSRPLWTVKFLRAARGRSAIVLRLHHVISDGLGIILALFPLLKVQEGEIRDYIPLPAALLGKKKGPSQEPRSNGGAAGSSNGAEQPQQRRGFFSKCCSWVCGCPRSFVQFMRGMLSLLVVKNDSEIKINPPVADRKPFLPFNQSTTFNKMPAVPMSIIKEVRKKHGCTVNDAIVAALSGAIHRHCAQDLEDPLFAPGRRSEDIECKCTMLLALPRPNGPDDRSTALCNQILTPICKLPVGPREPVQRLVKAKQVCDDLKALPFLFGVKATTKAVAGIIPMGPSKKLASEALSKMTANITSLPMATVPVSFCGEEIKEIQVLFVNPIPQISFITYNGMLYWNIIGNPDRLRDPQAIGRHFATELEALAKASPMES